ncbi:MAG: EpsG family protein [Erysipelotrichaceae bacterium]|nr:EpsG family protein [Erysipelotrichaceae bacterium]MCI1325789.1 EpsG family protein [Solobacterium sp.]MCH4043958.1 EpsG family protein [Erysipelotrichaceae bacterium]MCH4121173.1 EpsG family protein [Erysipelotrichaceae bacterium]MCI1362383.1 EpsG family protein [Solobacterium sp.]
MAQYLSTFIISCIFTYLAEKQERKKKKGPFIFFAVIAVLSGTFLAGVRSSSVGTDVMTYGNYVFEAAHRSSSPVALFKIYNGIGIEPLYLLLNFLVSRFTDDPHWFYFVFQFILLSFVLLGSIQRDRDQAHTDAWLSMWVFYTLFYGFSLNGMRQSMAVAIIYYGTTYIYNKDLKKYLIFTLLAAGFHYTAIMFLLFYFLNNYLESSKKNVVFKDVFMTFILLIVSLGYQYVIQFASRFVPKYIRYLGGESYSFSLNPFLIRIPFLLMFIVFYRKYEKRENHTDYWIIMMMGDLLLAQLRAIMPALYRISYYFGISKLETYPRIQDIFTKKSKIIVNTVIVVLLGILWYYQIVVQGNEGVYPYTSDVFNWLN